MERQRQEERRRKTAESFERQDAAYAARAEEWSQGFEDLLDAHEKYQRTLEELGVDLRKRAPGDPPVPKEARPVMRFYQQEQQRFWHGYASGISCDRCARPGEVEAPKGEGVCRHCGDTLGRAYGLYRAWALDRLNGSMYAYRRQENERIVDRLERILLRRLRDVG